MTNENKVSIEEPTELIERLQAVQADQKLAIDLVAELTKTQARLAKEQQEIIEGLLPIIEEKVVSKSEPPIAPPD